MHSSVDLVEISPGKTVRVGEFVIGKAPSLGCRLERRGKNMSRSMRERLLHGCTQGCSINRAEAGQNREIRQIANARIGLRARKTVGVELFGDVSSSRVNFE